ncbi:MULTISPECIES: exonuclease SbcCD subunit D [Terrabacteria group]|uniref:exonuclease SbcCD subunit D n=1 Tax=Bacillati TaxID=1783272 RepID=UPI001C6E46B3|nr:MULTISPECIES: exonuclease SbcCD subunit D [Terrabacteria group]MBW9212740.1 exonuclease SbcCD subunit D [Trueperella sp. zg.1013]
MKFAHIGDLHLGKVVNGHSFLEDQRYILNQILQQLEIKKVDCLLIAGDIYDKSVPSIEAMGVLNNFLKALHEKEIKVILISGNHDSSSRLAFGSSFFKQGDIYLQTNYSNQAIVLKDEYGPIYIYSIPYMNRFDIKNALHLEETPRLKEGYHLLLEDLKLDTKQRNILVAHQFVLGVSKPSEDSSEELMIGGSEEVSSPIFEDFDYVALGHIHKPEAILNASGRIRYSGSPLAYSKAEANQSKTMPIFSLKEKGSLEIELIPLQPRHEVKFIKATIKDVLMGIKAVDSMDYLYFELSDEYFPYTSISEIAKKYPNYMSIIPAKRKYNLQQTQSNTNMKSLNPLEIIATWYQQVSGHDLSDEQLAWVQKIWNEGEKE